MNQLPVLPMGLKVVAALFLLGGAVAAVEIVMALIEGRIHLDLSVLGLFVGLGLLGLRPGWRICALVLLWISLIALPIVGLIVLAQGAESGRYFFKLFGREAGEASKGAFLLLGALVFLLNAWQVRVLMREDVRLLFGPGSSVQDLQVD